ncbi:MAG TPA: glycoside hydrolase family 43 protein [Verrucomicrobiae bacterium]|jgi:GH43 family beta-xylosidase
MNRTSIFNLSFAPPLLLTAFAFLVPVLASSADPAGEPTFTNPIASRGADPWVIRSDSKYYYCQSRRNNGVWVNAATNLEDIGKGNWKCVWKPGPGTPWSREIWAPELHFIQGKWYIYVAADDGDNSNHRMYVLEGTSDDPTRPFTLKGKISPSVDRWAIDGTVLEMPDGKLYFIWSGWEGADNVAQNLYLAPMSDPWTIDGPRVCISRPEHAWEKHGLPINEGPEVLWHGHHLFVIYSASGMWTDNYCLGELAWNGGDVSNPKSWVKQPESAFSSSATVFGPGHCSFVTSPDGKEDWIIYHAHTYRGSGAERDIRMQRFSWNADGSPDFGIPVSAGVPLPRPSGE